MKSEIDSNRNLVLDFVKGIAMIMVILVHSRQWIFGLSPRFDFIKYGQMGCQIFFLISGFLCCALWERIVLVKGNASLKRLSYSHLKSFYLRKYIGLAPGYYLMIGVCWFLNNVIFTNESLGFATNDHWMAILRNILMVHGLTAFGNNDVVAGGWYIGTLILMILLFPLLFEVMYMFKKYIKRVTFGMLSVLLIIILCLYQVMDISLLGNNSFWYFNIITQLPCFVLGCLLYFNRDIRCGYSMLLVGAVCIVLSVLLFFSEMNFFLFIPLVFASGVYFILRTFLYKSEQWSGFENRGKILKVFSSVVRAFGRNSFYLYLAHPFFVWFLVREVQKWIKVVEWTISPNILYICLLPFMFGLSYLLAMGIKSICNPICKGMRTIVMDLG